MKPNLGVHVSRFTFHTALFSLLISAGCLRALAHDPYEITSTLSLFSNRTELQVELEFRAGMLLSGHTETLPVSEAPQLFRTIHGALAEKAERFFRLSVGGKQMMPAGAEVTLGLEDHIRFKLTYPRIAAAVFSLDAPGLQPLAELGPYGASLTVLDMENKKVLGQSVLFASTPPAEFNSKPSRAEPPPLVQPISLRPSQLTGQQRPAAAPSSHRPASATSALPIRIAFALGAFFALSALLCWSLSQRKEPGV